MPFNLFTMIIRFGFDAWELWSKIMRNDAVDAYSRNYKLKEKKNSLLAILKSAAHCRIDAAISSFKKLLF